jgi:hypothetical protein
MNPVSTAAPARHEPVFTADSRERVKALESIEVAAVVHLLNAAGHAERVLDDVATALAKQAEGRRAAVLAADTGSQDGTGEVIRGWARVPAASPFRVGFEVAGPAPRGWIVEALLRAAQGLGVRSCVLIDGALAGLSSEWLAPLLAVALAGEADFVSPAYSRGVGEGTLTTNLLAPLTRALYGKRVHQLAGGCAGFVRDVLDRWLARASTLPAWSTEGIEIGLVTEALAGDTRLVEVHLGPKPLDLGGAPPDLAATVVQTLGPILHLMEAHREVWPDVRGSAELPLVGEPPAVLRGGEASHGDRMVRAFRLGLKDLLPVWEQIMPEPTLARLYPLGLLGVDEFRLGPELWARVVSDFCVAYHERRLPHDHLLRALTPLYLGRVAAFLTEARALRADEVPEMLAAVGRAFEAEKDSLVARWR